MNETTVKLPELLAPAGGAEAGYAAFQYGADAVYTGLRRFSARAGAVNLSPDELADLAGYAHAQKKRRKVYVTLNTVTLDRELPELVPVLADIEASGADGVIVQDLGVARLVREHFPRLELHASTQMAIHNLQGAKALKALGFCRVNLARELTHDEVRRIAAESGLEVEVFVHGALCYCYSGMCLMSSHMYGRSGNRGSCAYPCREWFNKDGAEQRGVPGGDVSAAPSLLLLENGEVEKRRNRHGSGAEGGLMFSMKDMALPDQLPALCAAGVASLKIEGRMKSPLYVAAVTDFYRRLLDGKLKDPAERTAAEEDLRTIFSRPWTTLYADSAKNRDVIDPDQTGHRGAPVGTVARELGTRDSRSIEFTTTRELELHDGLQVDIPGTSRPYGFALGEFKVIAGPRAPDRFHILAGATVEVPVPPEAPPLPAGAQLYCASSQRVKRTYDFQMPRPGEFRERLPTAIGITMEPKRLLLAARTLPRFAGEPVAEAATELAGEFTPARNLAGTEIAARDAFSRLGDTRFTLAELELRNPQGLFAPASVLNQARRELVAKLDEAVQEAADARVDAVAEAVVLSPPGLSRWRQDVGNDDLAPLPSLHLRATDARPVGAESAAWSIFIDRTEYVAEFAAADWAGVEELIVDAESARLPELEKLRETLGPARLRLALPSVMRGWEEAALLEKIYDLRQAGFHNWLIPNLSAFSIFNFSAAEKLNADWMIPTFNRGALAQFVALGVERACLSPEDGAVNMKRLLGEFGERLTVVAYQDTPLMISESCPSAALAGGKCIGSCPADREEVLRSKRGENFLLCQRHCRSFVLHQKPFCLAARLPELAAAGARHFRVDFRIRRYEPGEVLRVWNLLRTGNHIPHTREGNYSHGI